MFRELFVNGSLFTLPVIAMLLFFSIFLTVLLRVLQRARRPEYDRMAKLPLDDPRERAIVGEEVRHS